MKKWRQLSRGDEDAKGGQDESINTVHLEDDADSDRMVQTGSIDKKITAAVKETKLHSRSGLLHVSP